MWTLASKFYNSVSHPRTAFHSQNSNCFLLSLIPLVYHCNRSSTLLQTQRKKNLSTTKFSTIQLLPLSSILSVTKNRSFLSSSSCIVSFVQKFRPFSIIASPTLAIIRSRHTGSIPIQCSRHANLSVHHPSPKSTKLPMWK